MPRPKPEELAPRLLPWYDAAKRDLPWRRTRDPYRILVSEVMLQQTQVSRVLQYYPRFLRAFPTCRALARAPEEEVLRQWQGLGYYARARHLQRACQAMVAQHGGRFPRAFAEAAALPGIGRYTAGAVLSIAFEQRQAAVEANVRRVLCRVLLEPGDTATSRARVARVAERAVPAARPGDYNQALMELGALLCSPRSPRCPECPLHGVCRAHARGRESAVPAAVSRRAESARVALAVVWRRGRVLLAHRAPKGRWAGLWEFPNGELVGDQDPRAALGRLLEQDFGLNAYVGEPLTELTHTIMHRRITLTAYASVAIAGRLRAGQHLEARWAKAEELEGYPLPSPHRKIADAVAHGW